MDRLNPWEGVFHSRCCRSANRQRGLQGYDPPKRPSGTLSKEEALAKADQEWYYKWNRMETPNTPKIPNVPPARFLQEVMSELRKVTWPSRDETLKLTAVVIALSVLVGAFIGGLDALLVQVQKIVFTR